MTGCCLLLLSRSRAGDAEGDHHAQGDAGAAQRVHAAQPGARRAQRHRPRLGHRRAVRDAQGHAWGRLLRGFRSCGRRREPALPVVLAAAS